MSAAAKWLIGLVVASGILGVIPLTAGYYVRNTAVAEAAGQIKVHDQNIYAHPAVQEKLTREFEARLDRKLDEKLQAQTAQLERVIKEQR